MESDLFLIINKYFNIHYISHHLYVIIMHHKMNIVFLLLVNEKDRMPTLKINTSNNAFIRLLKFQ